ncbi:MAG: bifunctional nuclease family protein [bacterium]|jgi:bifunctional DNase/RNase|nr:bifunctional nuclease family protein [bacterium]
MRIEMEFYELRLDETGTDQIVILKEKGGPRLMPILIGFYEAQAIHLSLNNVVVERPLTHDLAVGIIQALESPMERVVITELKNSTFYARIYLRSAGGVVDVDSRPSDALALAVRTNTPIFVEEEVLDQVAKM